MSVGVLSPDSLCRWQVQIYVYGAWRIPAILDAPSVQSRCTLWISVPTVYLFMADIANPELFVCVCRTWICLDITRFYEEQCQLSNGTAGPACPFMEAG